MVMRGAEVFWHLFGVVEIGDGGGEMRLAGEKDVLRATGEVGLVLLGERGDGEGVINHRSSVSDSVSHLA